MDLREKKGQYLPSAAALSHPTPQDNVCLLFGANETETSLLQFGGTPNRVDQNLIYVKVSLVNIRKLIFDMLQLWNNGIDEVH